LQVSCFIIRGEKASRLIGFFSGFSTASRIRCSLVSQVKWRPGKEWHPSKHLKGCTKRRAIYWACTEDKVKVKKEEWQLSPPLVALQHCIAWVHSFTCFLQAPPTCVWWCRDSFFTKTEDGHIKIELGLIGFPMIGCIIQVHMRGELLCNWMHMHA
jgi:hypothetical protein